MELRIGDRAIGDGHPPLIVAELSGNHGGSLDRALTLVDLAAKAGADALKLQTYTADTITIDVDTEPFRVADEFALWSGRTLHDLYDEAHTPWEWHAELFARARAHGMLAFSSPFDESAVIFLEELDAPAYKISSFEVTHLPLIAAAAATGKPLIISTGMATEQEISAALDCAREAGSKNVVLLKCTSAYPSDPRDSNLLTIPQMRSDFNALVGLSDHTLGTAASVAAVALGAVLIEKHFTGARDDGAVDSAFSLTPDELKLLVDECKVAWEARGSVHYGPTKVELASLHYRRSIYATTDIAPGEKLTAKNIRVVRPTGGLEPKEYPKVLGATARIKLSKGTPITWDVLNQQERS